MGRAGDAVVMGVYSLLLGLVLVAGAPYWGFRMLTSGRYRAGLLGRLGRVPAELRAWAAGRQVVWVHAVSVGEVLAATRLVRELEAGLNAPGAGVGGEWGIVVSTTTATGQALARERFGAGDSGRVFWYPLDFAWAVRGYVRALRPRMLVLMESELWPRMLEECERAGVPVAVVNARVSDRSFARGVKVRRVWGWVLRRVNLFLAQSEEDGRRLREMGAGAVEVTGNLKYDVRAPGKSRVAERIRELAAGRPVVVAGSTVGGTSGEEDEEKTILDAWAEGLRRPISTILVLAPRHPQRFGAVEGLLGSYRVWKASGWSENAEFPEIVLLDTIGDLAAVYGIADIAFVGGSLVKRGGHNPLEPAQFGVPVVMGASYENFRDVVGAMDSNRALRIVNGPDDLLETMIELLCDTTTARAMGERGKRVFEEQQGATGRTVGALVGLVGRGRGR